MSDVKDRAKIAAKEMIRTGWGRWSDAVTDLLAELERVESQSEKYRLEMISCGDGWEKANQRISELESENERLENIMAGWEGSPTTLTASGVGVRGAINIDQQGAPK